MLVMMDKMKMALEKIPKLREEFWKNVKVAGDGNSLNRIFAQYYGNDPNNWQSASPSPGVP